MKFKTKPSLMLILVVAMLGLLPLLAVLQYHWLGQVSQAEQERMQASLRLGVARFSEDFDRELARAYLTLQIDADTVRESAWNNYTGRYDQWFSTASYPKLVKNVYLVNVDNEGNLRLSQFDRAASNFNPVDWPEEFTGFRNRCEMEYQIVSSNDIPFIRTAMSPVASDIPALTIPLLPPMMAAPKVILKAEGLLNLGKRDMVINSRHFGHIRNSDTEHLYLETRTEIDNRSAFGYTLVTLNLDCIKEEIIPTLTKRYFSNGNQSEYNLAVLSTDSPQRVIYQSAPGISEKDLSKGDATADLLRVQLDKFDTLFIDSALAKKGIPRMRRFESKQTFNFHQRVPAPDPNFKVTRIIESNIDKAPWQLVLKHRAGSLEAAVSSVRRRNLFVSFGILLLLGTSMVLIAISSRRAQRLARQQMEFVAGVSHELRTPLAVIRSAGENLADGVISEQQQVKRYGALIENEGRRLTDMVEQILEFAGWQSGRKKYQLLPLDVTDVIEGALSASSSQIKEGGFDIERNIEQDLPLVMADLSALQRSIQNLLSNAMKYSGTSRWIGIRAGSAKGERGDEVRITVQDRGLGIGLAEQSHIFEPFYRGEEVMAAQIHGSGLGLSLVKQSIEACGGRVSVESTPGHGSSFTLHLPAIAQTQESCSESIKGDYEQANFARRG
jgi:signal transduction histidine kinase